MLHLHFGRRLGCNNSDHEFVVAQATPRLLAMVITPDGNLLGRCEGQVTFSTFLGASEDLVRNVHGVANVAALDGDEVGFLVAKIAEIKRQK